MLKVHNKTLFISTIFLALFGLLMIYSASFYSAQLRYSDKFFYLKKQSVAFIFSIIAFFICKKINLEFLKKIALPFYLISLILLALLFIPGLGVDNYGATRWINLGFTTFQPSEIAKFALVMYLSEILSKESANKWSVIIKSCCVALIMVFLVLLEPNMSIAMCMCFVFLIMLIVGGIKTYQFATLLIPGIIGVIFLILVEPYRLKRLMAFIDPWASPLNEGYQLIQSYYALAAGKWFGVGLFNSTQKLLFLPFAESDFIFSIIGEEFGLIGCIGVITLFLVVIFNGIKISINAKDRFSQYLACGITSVIAVQTLLNIAVVSGSIPPTGLPLPFVSYGGTSLVVFMAFIGVLDNIAKNNLSKYGALYDK